MTLTEKKHEFFKWAYGLFIHYGTYSTLGRGEWALFHERMTPEEYFAQTLPGFKPKKGCAKEWIQLAVRGGMKYAVLTTRHHEGYFIGDELLKEFVEACRENGLGVGFYYSVADWSDPGYCAGPADKEGWEKFVVRTHKQIKEIMSNYGKIDYLFYDGCPPPATWRLPELHKEIRAMQPEMLICRCEEDTDLKSCEGHSNGSPDNLWESCYTLNDSWGYVISDNNWKSPERIINMLTTNRHNGGNLLLNVGPMADGTVQQEAIDIISKVGDWLKVHGEAVYDIVPHPFAYHDQRISTGKGTTAYIRINRWHGNTELTTGIGNKVKSITLMENGQPMPYKQEGEKLWIDFTGFENNRPYPYYLKLELDGEPIGIPNPKRPNCNIKTTGE